MIEVILDYQFALRPYFVETLAVGVRHYAVGCAVNDECRALILGCRLVDRQTEGRADIVAAEFQTAEQFYILARVKRVIHLTHRVASDSIVAQHSGRCHQRYSLEGRLPQLLTQLSGCHRGYHAAL